VHLEQAAHRGKVPRLWQALRDHLDSLHGGLPQRLLQRGRSEGRENPYPQILIARGVGLGYDSTVARKTGQRGGRPKKCPHTSGDANFNFNATCTGEYTGAPKFLVGEQTWKAELNDSLLNAYLQNDTSGFITTNISLQGDIALDFVTPDGSTNFTQEQTITFLGATVDDCGDALATTVIYNANTTTTDGFECTNNTQVGANAFQCIFTTTTATSSGYYNASMYANSSSHYDNDTANLGTGGLFYIDPLRRLASQNVVPTNSLFATKNWNFSIRATSGDTALRTTKQQPECRHHRAERLDRPAQYQRVR